MLLALLKATIGSPPFPFRLVDVDACRAGLKEACDLVLAPWVSKGHLVLSDLSPECHSLFLL